MKPFHKNMHSYGVKCLLYINKRAYNLSFLSGISKNYENKMMIGVGYMHSII